MSKVLDIRKDELRQLRIFSYLNAAHVLMMSSAPILVSHQSCKKIYGYVGTTREEGLPYVRSERND